MIQDRKTLSFETRPITFQLMATTDSKKAKKKCLGKVTIDLRDYSFHKLEKTLIFAFGDCGATLVLSIFCSWKSFNGDLVDNYEKLKANRSLESGDDITINQSEDFNDENRNGKIEKDEIEKNKKEKHKKHEKNIDKKHEVDSVSTDTTQRKRKKKKRRRRTITSPREDDICASVDVDKDKEIKISEEIMDEDGDN